MWQFIKNRARWVPLLSVLFLSQCCCIVIPFSGQVDLNSPSLQQIAAAVKTVLVSTLEVGNLLGSYAQMVSW